MKVSEYLYESVKDIWEDCYKHHFVQEIEYGLQQGEINEYARI